MTSTPSGGADNLDDLYAVAEQKVRAALAADRNDLAERASADLADLVGRIDDVTAAIAAETGQDHPERSQNRWSVHDARPK